MTNYVKSRISNPSQYFETPDHVLSDGKLSRREKEKVLRSMAAESMQMIQAASEGMGAGEPAFKAEDFQSALKRLRDLETGESKGGSTLQSGRFQRIVVVTTVNQDLNREIANVAFDLAEITNGKVSLLSVVPPAIEGIGLATAAPMASAVAPVAVDNSQIKKDRKDLLTELKIESGRGVETDIEVRSGRIEDVVVDYANDRHADVIVVGSRNRSWLEALIKPSTASSVTKVAPCPVLVVPETGK